MAKIDIKDIQILRDKTGMGMLDCKKALEETAGDIDKAIEILRKKGVAVAQKRADKNTAEGLVHAYIHPGDQVGVLVEVNCETDFVARTKELKEFANNIGMQIVAQKPMYLNPEEVDPKFLEHEKDIMKAQLADSGKPEKILDQIIAGKVNKLYSDVCLLKQPYIKNDQLTVEQLLQELIAKTGENIKIKRFCRFEIGA
jgi:elongation factor Ts